MWPTLVGLHPEFHVPALDGGVLAVSTAEWREQCGRDHTAWVQNHHFLVCGCENFTQLLWASVSSAAKWQSQLTPSRAIVRIKWDDMYGTLRTATGTSKIANFAVAGIVVGIWPSSASLRLVLNAVQSTTVILWWAGPWCPAGERSHWCCEDGMREVRKAAALTFNYRGVIMEQRGSYLSYPKISLLRTCQEAWYFTIRIPPLCFTLWFVWAPHKHSLSKWGTEGEE